jgi:hypothetical protein
MCSLRIDGSPHSPAKHQHHSARGPCVFRRNLAHGAASTLGGERASGWLHRGAAPPSPLRLGPPLAERKWLGWVCSHARPGSNRGATRCCREAAPLPYSTAYELPSRVPFSWGSSIDSTIAPPTSCVLGRVVRVAAALRGRGGGWCIQLAGAGCGAQATAPYRCGALHVHSGRTERGTRVTRRTLQGGRAQPRHSQGVGSRALQPAAQSVRSRC